MKIGDQVEALCDITSDDQEITGLDYGDPVIKKGTKGIVLAKSQDTADHIIKGDEDCFLIKFDCGNCYDCLPQELKVV